MHPGEWTQSPCIGSLDVMEVICPTVVNEQWETRITLSDFWWNPHAVLSIHWFFHSDSVTTTHPLQIFLVKNTRIEFRCFKKNVFSKCLWKQIAPLPLPPNNRNQIQYGKRNFISHSFQLAFGNIFSSWITVRAAVISQWNQRTLERQKILSSENLCFPLKTNMHLPLVVFLLTKEKTTIKGPVQRKLHRWLGEFQKL